MRQFAWVVGVCWMVVGGNWQQTARAESPHSQVEAAAAALDAWLGENDNADRWHAYLKSSDLRAQLALADGADPALVEQVLAQYQSQNAGLEAPQFGKVRAALDNWLGMLSLPNAAELPTAARAAKASFVRPAPQDLESSREATLTAMKALDAWLGSGASGPGWKTYLHWPALEAELAKEQDVDIAGLRQVLSRLDSGYAGLDRPEFAALAAALDDYLLKLDVAQDPQAQHVFDGHLEALATALEVYPASHDSQQAEAIGRTLVWLESRGQAPRLVAAVRRAYGQPNLYIQASEDLVGDGMERPVDEPTYIHENILGADVRGYGRTVGHIDVQLVPSPKWAAWDVITRATTHSDNVAHKGKATVHSSGVTDFTSHKRIFMTAEGLSSWCSIADACTHSCIHCVSSGMGRGGILTRMTNNIAWKKVMQSKAQAEYIGARKAERRVTERVDRDGAERLAKSNKNYYAKFRQPLVDEHAFPPQLDFSTTTDNLHIVALQAGTGQMGAPNGPPGLTAPHDFSTRLHETLVDNHAALTLAGQTILEEEFDKEMKRLLGDDYKDEPPVVEEEADEEEPGEEGAGPKVVYPWRITLAEQDPVSMRFRDGLLTFTIRATKFKTKTEFELPLTITVVYKLEPAGKGFVALRQGDVTVEPTDPNYNLNNQDIVRRNRVRRRFENFYKETKTVDGLTLPGDWEKSGKLELVQLGCDGGWLTTSWIKPTSVPNTGLPLAPADPPPPPQP